MYFLLFILLSHPASANYSCSKHPIYCQIKSNMEKDNIKASDSSIMELSNHIYNASKKYNVPSNIYTAILMQESRYTLNTTNRSCGLDKNKEKLCTIHDFGIAQINYLTVLSYNMDTDRLLEDLEYSVDSGAKVLSWFKSRYMNKEKNMWWTRYNCGTRPNVNRKTCLSYKNNIEKWL